MMELKADYYDKVHQEADASRYKKLYELIGNEATGKVLDIGCGVAYLQRFIKDYHGFDFSQQAIEMADNVNVWLGNAYDKSNYDDYDTYILAEVLEHLDDFRVLENIPRGKKVLLSVPSFYDEGHLRVYTKELAQERYKDVLRIENIIRLDCKFKEEKPFEVYVLLIEAIKL
jgi:SAM-dependent methyltransferase